MVHLDHGALNVLKEIVMGLHELKIEKHEVYKGCVLWKYDKTKFPSSNSRCEGILDLIHLDVCGPMSIGS